MNKLIFFSFLLCIFSCTPDGKFDGKYDGDTNIVIDQPVDTFSVKHARPLTPEEKAEIEKNKPEVDSIINNANSIINQGNPDNPTISDDFSSVVLNPDIGPSFPGGQAAMDAFIAKRKIYPLVAFQNDITGTVMVKFVVEKDGKIGGIKVLKGLGYGCDESASDLIRSMPKWIPGQKGGAAVRCAVTLPVSFGS